MPELVPEFLFAGTVPANKFLFAGTVPANKFLFAERFREITSSLKDKKVKFWNFNEKEALNAWNNGLGFIFHCDGNLWAGSDLIPGDPRTQNKNGKIFSRFSSKKSQFSTCK